jgi:hypothetical protein
MLAMISYSFGGTVAVYTHSGEIGYESSDVLVEVLSILTKLNKRLRMLKMTVQSVPFYWISTALVEQPVASEEIMTAVKNCKKPVVSWISDSAGIRSLSCCNRV